MSPSYKDLLRQEGFASIPAVLEGCSDPIAVLSALKCAGLLQLPLSFVGDLPEVEWALDDDLDVGRLVALMGLAEAAPAFRKDAEDLILSVSLLSSLVPLPPEVRDEALGLKAALGLPPEHLASRMLEELSFQGDFSPEFSESVSRGIARAGEAL